MANNKVSIDLELKGDKLVERGLRGVGDAAEDAGDDLDKMAKDAGFLDKRIGELRGGLKEMFAEFDKVGDKDVLKKIKIDQRELGQLDRLKKQIAGLDKDDKGGAGTAVKQLAGAGAEAGGKFGQEFTKSLMSLKGPAIGVLASVAAIAAPAMAGVISAAVLGGVGVGGIVGGLALAAQDSRVQAAGELLGATAMSAFSKSASVFVQPAIDAMSVLDGAVDSVAGGMREAFTAVAPALVPLTRGLTGLVKEMLPGLIDAMKGARPVLMTVGAELPKIGRALSNFLTTIAKDPRGAILAFQDLSRIIQGTLLITGKFLAVLSTIWAKLSPIIQMLGGDIAGALVSQAAMNSALKDAEDAALGAADGFGDVGDAAGDAKTKLVGLNDAIDAFIGKQLGVDQAQVSWQKGLRDLREELTEGKRTLALNSEEGLKNRDAMLEMIAQAESFRQALFAQTNDLEGANAAYLTNIQTLYNMGAAAGFSKKELDALFGPYINGPRVAITEFQFPGLTAGLERARELSRLLGSKAAASAAGGNYLNNYTSGTYVSGRAVGGPVMAGQTYVVGENGPEVLQMGSANGHIYNNQQTQGMMSGASGGAAMPMVIGGTLRYVGPGGAVGDLAAVLMTMFRVEIAAQGGNVQTVMGGG